MMHIQPIQKMVMDGKNYLVKECADILLKILDFPHPSVEEEDDWRACRLWLVSRWEKEVRSQVLSRRVKVNERMSLLQKLLFARLTDCGGFDKLVDHVKKGRRGGFIFHS